MISPFNVPLCLPCPAWDRLNAIAALAAAVTLMDRRAFRDTDLAQRGDLFLATWLEGGIL